MMWGFPDERMPGTVEKPKGQWTLERGGGDGVWTEVELDMEMLC